MKVYLIYRYIVWGKLSDSLRIQDMFSSQHFRKAFTDALCSGKLFLNRIDIRCTLQSS